MYSSEVSWWAENEFPRISWVSQCFGWEKAVTLFLRVGFSDFVPLPYLTLSPLCFLAQKPQLSSFNQGQVSWKPAPAMPWLGRTLFYRIFTCKCWLCFIWEQVVEGREGKAVRRVQWEWGRYDCCCFCCGTASILWASFVPLFCCPSMSCQVDRLPWGRAILHNGMGLLYWHMKSMANKR